MGRFISEDPVRWLDGGNFYAYVRNGPLVSRDPLGLFWVRGFDPARSRELGLALDFVAEALLGCCVEGELRDDLWDKLYDDKLVFEFDRGFKGCGLTPEKVVWYPDQQDEWVITLSGLAWGGCCKNFIGGVQGLAATVLHELVHIGRPNTCHFGCSKSWLPDKVAYDCFDCEGPEWPQE